MVDFDCVYYVSNALNTLSGWSMADAATGGFKQVLHLRYRLVEPDYA
jgi:hypothetical protein